MELKAIIAGLLFGAWPILMQRSHLPGNIQSFVFAGGTFLIVSFFAISGFKNIHDPNWTMAILGTIAGGFGLAVFTKGLALTDENTISAYFVLMIVVQATIPAIYKIVIDGKGINFEKTLGFALAIVATFLLTKK